MGMLIDGHWRDEARTIDNGAYVRPTSPFSDPVPEQIIQAVSAEPGRFHLIASLSCPWSHRLTLIRAIKKLETALPLHIACGPRTQGYRVAKPGQRWQVPGTNQTIEHLHQLNTRADPGITARATEPMLWDAVDHRIVSNESATLLPAQDAVSSAATWPLSPPALPG